MDEMRFRCWSVAAGFPSPAESWRESPLNLNDLLLPHPDATYFVRVRGASMRGAGIHDRDLLIVDRALEATHGQIIVAKLQNRFTIKRLLMVEDRLYLQSGHPRYPTFEIQPQMQFQVWGVVLFVIHPLHPVALARLQPDPGSPR
jgi:DNA polymerase V